MSVINTNPTLLRDKVRGAYSSAAEQPTEKHAFPVGKQFAESLGYPAELLASLPSVACDAFAGVSNVSLFAEVPVGATVLDDKLYWRLARLGGNDRENLQESLRRRCDAKSGQHGQS
jgi:hypothetical protein